MRAFQAEPGREVIEVGVEAGLGPTHRRDPKK